MVGPILTLGLTDSTYQPVQFALFHLRALSAARRLTCLLFFRPDCTKRLTAQKG